MKNKNHKIADRYISKGLKYFKKYKYEKALEKYNKAIELNPNNAIAYKCRGDVFSRAPGMDCKLGIEDYTKAIELKPNFSKAYSERAFLYYFDCSDFSNAINDYSRCIKYSPNYFDAYFARGLIYEKLKIYDLAVKDFKKAISLKPDMEPIYEKIEKCIHEVKQINI